MQENGEETTLSNTKLWVVPVEKCLHIQSLDRLFKCGFAGWKAIGSWKALQQAKSFKDCGTFPHYRAHDKLVSKFRIELLDYYAALQM
jgi:hypothetical protein